MRFALLPLPILAGLAILPPVRAALADPAAIVADEAKPDTAALLADLDADDLAVREAATRRLSTDPALAMIDIEALLARPDLSPEQAARLLSAARDRFLRSPRAALGVQFENGVTGPVIIAKTFERFPAAGILKPGDEILAVEGQPVVNGWQNFRPLIISREPGESLKLRLRRAGEVIELAAPLGRYSDLPPQRALALDDLARAWETRSQAYAASISLPPVAVSPEPEWTPRGQGAIDMEWHRRFDADSPRVAMVPGGHPAGPLSAIDSAVTEPRVVFGGGEFRAPAAPPAPAAVLRRAAARNNPENQARTQIVMLREQIARAQTEAARLQAALGGPNLDDATRRQLQVRLLNAETQVLELQRQSDMLRARLPGNR